MNFEPVIGRLGVTFIVTFKSKTTLARKLSWKENNVKKINDNGRREKKRERRRRIMNGRNEHVAFPFLLRTTWNRFREWKEQRLIKKWKAEVAQFLYDKWQRTDD